MSEPKIDSQGIIEAIVEARLQEFKAKLLSDEAVEAAYETSSNRHYRTPQQEEQYKDRMRVILRAVITAAEGEDA